MLKIHDASIHPTRNPVLVHNLHAVLFFDNSSLLAIDLLHNLDHPVIGLHQFHEIVAHSLLCNHKLIYCY